jgi:hypothetical protein
MYYVITHNNLFKGLQHITTFGIGEYIQKKGPESLQRIAGTFLSQLLSTQIRFE